MPARVPTLDVYALARDRARVGGGFALADLTRLATSLASTGGDLAYTIDGQLDERGRPGAAMHLTATLELQCQRCNTPLALALDRRATFRFVGSEEELEALPVEDDETDVVVGSHHMDVRAWVEDEAILSLPLVPRHDRCVGPARADAPDDEPPQRPNPFSVLAGLGNRRGDGGGDGGG